VHIGQVDRPARDLALVVEPARRFADVGCVHWRSHFVLRIIPPPSSSPARGGGKRWGREGATVCSNQSLAATFLTAWTIS
jgi:hypothetical protein